MFDDDEYSASVVLPLICAVSFGLAVVSYFYIEEKTVFLIGSPSSTYCLVYLIIPFFVAIGVIAGAIFGLILSFIFLLCGLPTLGGGKFVLLCLILIVGPSLITGTTGFMMVRNNVKFNEPRVIYTNESLTKETIDLESVVSDTIVVTFEQLEKGRSLVWNNTTIILSFPEDRILAIDKDGNIVIQTLLDYKFPYICQSQIREIRLSSDGKKYLAIIAELRATSRRAMLLIYNPSGSLIYQEMFDTHEQDIIMGINRLNSGIEALILKNKNNVFSYSKK